MKQAVYGAQQIRGLDGLQEKRLGRLLGFQDAGAASLVGRQSAHGDDPDIGAELRQRAGQFRAAETGHVHIGDDEGDFRGTGDEQDDSLHAVGAAHDTVAVLFENGGADMAEPFVVVHDEDQFAVTVWNVNGRGARGLGRLALNGGQEHAERRAAANHRVQFDEAFVVGHDTAHRGKPEPGALARSLGREERGPDSFQYIGRDAGARVAMPQGGTLCITAANRRLNAAEATKIPGARPGPWLVFEVGDTGTGITPDVLERIWTPFFTTKGTGKG